MKRVVVGLSGGVDSSVAAFLLKEQGYDVIGLFMKNWHDETVTISNECPWEEDSNDALLVAEKLNIPFQTVDLSEAYKNQIVDYMFEEYKNGRTPNPDVLCNREIKYAHFLDIAMSLGADFVATGHYCQKAISTIEGEEIHHLIAGKDKNKDQSYFLCQLNQHQLSKAIFPIGHLEKSEVREIAARENLITANKKDSQGLCFIGKVKLPTFLQQQLKPKKGNIIRISPDFEQYKSYEQIAENDLEKLAESFIYTENNGTKVGEHNGAHYFTIGQRKGLGVGGHIEPLFVIATDTKTNTVYVGEGHSHKGLYKKCLKINSKDIHWTNPTHLLKNEASKTYKCRIRYRQPLVNVTLRQLNNDLYILFQKPMEGITPGQFAAWYEEEELIGSGVISL